MRTGGWGARTSRTRTSERRDWVAARRDLTAIFDAAVSAADPGRLVERHLRLVGDHVHLDAVGARWTGPLLVVGAGKAAARMAAGCERRLGSDRVRGLVVIAEGCAVRLDAVAALEAAHPLPDQRGLDATERICRLLTDHHTGPVLCLISGGASSLLVRPRPGVSLEDKLTCNRLLYHSGADIEEVNTVRKHLSQVKGGGLLRFVRDGSVATLILSDVIGDDPAVIGSGPSVADRSTFSDAQAVLEQRHLLGNVPDSVCRLLAAGVRGEVPESVKPDDPVSQRASHVVIGSNRTALEAAAVEATRRGYKTVVTPQPLSGDTTVAARHWIEGVKTLFQEGEAAQCVVAGGETTVEVTGSGKGGRNQEFALALVSGLDGSRIAVLSAGTDGIDGPTDAAGAFVDGGTRRRAGAHGLDPVAALRANDSYPFFDRLGDLLRCGPTGTNVMDIKIALGLPAVLAGG